MRISIKFIVLAVCICILDTMIFSMSSVEARNKSARNRGIAAGVYVGASANAISRDNSQKIDSGDKSQQKREEIEAAARFKNQQNSNNIK